MIWKIVALGAVENYTTGWVLHYVYLPGKAETHQALGTHSGHGTQESAEQQLSPLLHFLRDSTLALPVTIAVLLLVAVAWRTVARRTDTATVRITFAAVAAVTAAVASVPEVLVHGWLFDEQVAGSSHLVGVALVTLRYSFALTLMAVVLFGVPWRAPRSTPIYGEA